MDIAASTFPLLLSTEMTVGMLEDLKREVRLVFMICYDADPPQAIKQFPQFACCLDCWPFVVYWDKYVLKRIKNGKNRRHGTLSIIGESHSFT